MVNTSLALSLSVLGLTFVVPPLSDRRVLYICFLVVVSLVCKSVTASLYVVLYANYGQELYSVIVKLHALSLVGCNHSQLNLASLVTISARSSIVQNERNTAA